jgi:hypothetical protein
MSNLPSKKSKKPREVKIAFTLDSGMLGKIVAYIVSGNALVVKKALVKVKELFSLLDESCWNRERDKEVKVYLINSLLSGMLDRHISDITMLCRSVMEGEYEDEIADIFGDINDNGDLSNDDVVFIEEYISDRLQFAFVHQRQAELASLMESFNRGDFKNMREWVNKARPAIEGFHMDMRSADAQDRHAAKDFSTDPESVMAAVLQAQTELNAPSNVLRTGVRQLNDMVGPGGFQGGRVYVFLAITGGWKSGMLLNIACDAVKHNPDIRTKDPTKTPVVLMVSQENSQTETMERMYSYHVGTESELKDADPAVFAEIMSGGYGTDGRPVLEVRYRPNKSISVATLDAMCHDLEMEGKEVVMIVQDYIKRIKSNTPNEDIRLELGQVVDDMATLAKERQIPIITASQLNREAFKTIELAAGKKPDMAKMLGMSHVGESALMLENADGIFVLHREQSPEGKNYLTVKKLKVRGKDTPVHYFAHPMDNTMRLAPDVHLPKSLSLKEMADGISGFDGGSQQQGSKGPTVISGSRAPRRPGQALPTSARPQNITQAKNAIANMFPSEEGAEAGAVV